MPSVFVNTSIALNHQGNVYNCQWNNGTVLADTEADLFEQMAYVTGPEYKAPFEGNGFTWTFVKHETAGEYQIAREHPEFRANAVANPTFALGGGFTPYGTFMVYPRTATYEAIDWIDENATSKVIAWTLPCTDYHFYMFEDPKEALLFKLQFVG